SEECLQTDAPVNVPHLDSRPAPDRQPLAVRRQGEEVRFSLGTMPGLAHLLAPGVPERYEAIRDGADEGSVGAEREKGSRAPEVGPSLRGLDADPLLAQCGRQLLARPGGHAVVQGDLVGGASGRPCLAVN